MIKAISLILLALISQVSEPVLGEQPSNVACIVDGNRVIALSGTDLKVIENDATKTIKLRTEFDSIVPVPKTNYVLLIDLDEIFLLDLTTESVNDVDWLPYGKICTCAASDDSRIMLALWSRVPVVKRLFEIDNDSMRSSDMSSTIIFIGIEEFKSSIKENRDPVFESIKLTDGAEQIPSRIFVGSNGLMVQMVSAIPRTRRGKRRMEHFSVVDVLLVDQNKDVKNLLSCEIIRD